MHARAHALREAGREIRVCSRRVTAERFFSLDYVERAVLRDASTIARIRLLAAEDKDILRRGFELLSPSSRYARFMAPKQRLTDDELRYLTEVDQERHFAIGAIAEDGDGHGNAVGLGIARVISLPDPPAGARRASPRPRSRSPITRSIKGSASCCSCA